MRSASSTVRRPYSRFIVGWSIADHMRTELVVDPLGMATLLGDPRRFDDPALRQRTSIFFMGVRATIPCRRTCSHQWALSATSTTFHDGHSCHEDFLSFLPNPARKLQLPGWTTCSSVEAMRPDVSPVAVMV
jgi:hypothetical protein